jgi:Uma2 family endonuclease
MTAAMSDYLPPADGWTVDDLDAMPDDGVRRELLDGVLLVSPSPTDIHGVISGLLFYALYSSCPLEYHVTQGVSIQINNRRSFIPDVLVTTAEAASRKSAKYAPHEVVLAVEIVSPSTQSMDRITKPALYASAGIPYYWRVETSDGKVEVSTYKIDPESEIYRPFGSFDVEIDTAEPWPIKLPIAQIKPRFL